MKKIGVICLALVLALGSLGVGYALWSDTLFLEGTVETGEVDWEFESFSILDPFDDNSTIGDWNIDPGFSGAAYQTSKSVGWITGVLVDGLDGDGDNSTLNLTFHNMYPCYYNSINLYPICTGNVPIHFTKATISNEYGFSYAWTAPYPYEEKEFDITGDNVSDIEFQWGDSLGIQMHKGDSPPEISFKIHILQAAPQGFSNGKFSIKLEAVQYNEAP